MPRDPFTSTRSPGRTCTSASVGRLRAGRDMDHRRAGHPRGDCRVRQAPGRLTADGDEQSSPAAAAARAALARAARSAWAPSSSISPRTATFRALPVAAAQRLERALSAAGLELYESSMSVMPPGSRSTSPRRAAGSVVAARSAIVVERHAELDRDGGRRRARSSRLPRPSSGVSTTRRPPASGHGRARMPSRPRSSHGLARTSAASDHAEGHEPAGERAARAPSARRPRWRPGGRRGAHARGSPPWRRQSRRPRRRSRGARRRRWSRRGRRARRCRPASGFLPRDSCPVRPPPRPGRARSSSSESGRPMWLFRVPLVPKHRDIARPGTPRSSSFVVVLPALPVIATTFAPERRRTSRAPVLQRRVVSSTSIRSGAGPACPASGKPASARHHRAGRTRGQRGGHEVVPVEPIAAHRDEEIPGCSDPRVDRPPLDALRRVAARPPGRRSRRRSRRRSARIGSTRPGHPRAAAPARRAPRAPPRRRRTAASDRRSPGTSRVPCRRSAPDRRAWPRAIARSIASRRSTIASDGVPCAAPSARSGPPA